LLSDATLVADEPEGFSDSILMLLGNEKARLDLASRALERIGRFFTPDACYGPVVEEIERSTTPRAERSSCRPLDLTRQASLGST
jgi:hypothetical protein